MALITQAVGFLMRLLSRIMTITYYKILWALPYLLTAYTCDFFTFAHLIYSLYIIHVYMDVYDIVGYKALL